MLEFEPLWSVVAVISGQNVLKAEKLWRQYLGNWAG